MGGGLSGGGPTPSPLLDDSMDMGFRDAITAVPLRKPPFGEVVVAAPGPPPFMAIPAADGDDGPLNRKGAIISFSCSIALSVCCSAERYGL